MINLIPTTARSKIVTEYWLRVVAVWMFLFGTGCLVVASLLLPTYMLLRGELTALRNEVIDNEARVASFSTSAKELAQAMERAQTLLAVSGTPVTQFDARLNEIAGSAVAIESALFTLGTSTVTITITGIAETRSALATFRDAVEASPEFANTVLPISSLIKDRDLDFTMTITGSTTPLAL